MRDVDFVKSYFELSAVEFPDFRQNGKENETAGDVVWQSHMFYVNQYYKYSCSSQGRY